MAHKKVILCIDDEMSILTSLKTELKSIFKQDYLIEVAEGGEDALELVDELLDEGFEISLVISDYLMPQMKGDEVLKHIHQKSPASIKIMLTGQATMEGVASAIKHAKLYRYIAKPWQAEDFKLTVKEAIKTYKKNEELTVKNILLENLNTVQAKLIEELHEKEKSLQHALDAELKLREAASRFVPSEFISLLGHDSIANISLGDAIQKEMTVFFSDIRGFTSLSEQMTPEENFKFINSYLNHMEPYITEHHGFVDKYIGDAIMALFSGEADDAVKAGIAMLKQLVIYNGYRANCNYQALKIGIGINTGSLILGTIGGKARMEGTVISDAVNLSARTEGLTKKYGVPLLITHHTFSKLKKIDEYALRKIDNVQVKGKEKTTTIYEVFNADSDKIKNSKLESLETFNAALSSYNEDNFISAKRLFVKCLDICPEDSVSKIYLSRIFQQQSVSV